jgi:hypothetical protein
VTHTNSPPNLGNRGASLARRCVALPLLLPLLIAASPVLAQPNDGEVSGQIVNNTGEGGPPGGVSVKLITFGRKEQVALGQRITVSDANGHYAFSGLDRDPNLVYVPFARYAEVTYRPDELAHLQDRASRQLDIPVYESTTDDGALQLERLNLVLAGADQGMLQFMEMGAVLNSGDHTFVTANPQDLAAARALRFPVPQGALGIQMQSGFSSQDLTSGIGGVQVTSPLPPGRHEFALSFQLPYAGSSADLTLQLPYPTRAYSLYVPDTGVHLDTTGLAADGSILLGDRTYVVYSGSELPRAAIVAGQLTGLGGSPILGASQLAVLSLAVVLSVLGGGVLFFRRRTRRTRTAAGSGQAHLAQERRDLVIRIAALDECFAAGDVSRDEYPAERRLAKQRLRELTSGGT